MAAAPFDLDQWARVLLNIASVWSTAIHAPKTLLQSSPTDQQLIDGIVFYLEMLGVSALLSAPMILQHKDKADLGDNVRLAAGSAFQMVSYAVFALACNFAFGLFGGTGRLAGSFLAMAYGFSPYGPLLTVASLYLFASLPPSLQPYALSLASAQEASQKAIVDSRTNLPLFYSASVLSVLILIASYVVFLRGMIFVHGSHGVRTAASILVSLIGIVICGLLITPIQKLITPPPTENIPDEHVPERSAKEAVTISPDKDGAIPADTTPPPPLSASPALR